MSRYVVDAEAKVASEVQTLNVTDEVKALTVKVTAPAAPPTDDFWIVLTAVFGLLAVLMVL